MIEEILLFGAVLLAIGLVFASTLRTATPPLPTSPSVRKTLLAMLPSQVDGLVYDLGSGWGGLARTLARRAERAITRLARREQVSPAALQYINRLSDHLFVLGRFLNDKGAGDVLWVPGGTRDAQ